MPKRINQKLVIHRLSVAFLLVNLLSAQNQGTLTILHQFSAAGDSIPDSGLVEINPGLFYSTTRALSLTGATIYAVTSSGQFATVHNFDYATEGVDTAQLLQAANGKLYGMNGWGGATNFGSIFDSDLRGNVTVLQTPPGAAFFMQGISFPLIESADGFLYGVTPGSGSIGDGTFFRMNLSGQLTILHTFNTSEGYPSGPVVEGADGNFYGESTLNGGINGSGTVYRMTRAGVLTTLYAFVGPFTDGAGPAYGLLQATNGVFYGITQLGGSVNAGTIFAVTSSGGYKLLHSFSNDGPSMPMSALMEASDGNLYGTAAFNLATAPGVIYRMTLNGTFSVVHALPFSPFPIYGGRLYQGSDGKLYGTNGDPVFSLDLGIPKPKSAVTGFFPAAGVTGSQVVLMGRYFVGATSVSFNGMPATFVRTANSYILTQVPSGATSGPITIITTNGVAQSAKSFIVR